MLGHQMFGTFLKNEKDVHGVARKKEDLISKFGAGIDSRIHTIEDVKNFDSVENLVNKIQPDYVINCVGIVKQSSLANNYLESIAINSYFPHQLENLGAQMGFKLIHISTDCVFNGTEGFYSTTHLPNATDLYGKSKHLGEVGYGIGMTLRTSIIGHELTKPTFGLVEWFLGQEARVQGYTQAIFSGVTTYELSKILLENILGKKWNPDIYHIASSPISKYDLLNLIAKEYGKEIAIDPSQEVTIDRSLDGSVFNDKFNYKQLSWKQQIGEMKLCKF